MKIATKLLKTVRYYFRCVFCQRYLIPRREIYLFKPSTWLNNEINNLQDVGNKGCYFRWPIYSYKEYCRLHSIIREEYQ